MQMNNWSINGQLSMKVIAVEYSPNYIDTGKN